MAKAPVERTFSVAGFEDVDAGIVAWPMSVIRLSGTDTDRIIALADVILNKWREYTDEEAFIYAYTDNEPHNTITPIARKRGDKFELDLVLRNNITTEEHPPSLSSPCKVASYQKREYRPDRGYGSGSTACPPEGRDGASEGSNPRR